MSDDMSLLAALEATHRKPCWDLLDQPMPEALFVKF